MAKTIELPCNVGDKIYWLWCDYKGEPNSDIQEDIIMYFYIDNGGIGISVDWLDGNLGHYTKDGELVDGILRMFLNRENAENYIQNNNNSD